MTLRIEMVENSGVDGGKLLERSHSAESEHRPSPVVEIVGVNSQFDC